MLANDLAQTPADTIPDDRPTDPFRRDETGSERSVLARFKHAEHEILTALRPAFVSDAGEVDRTDQPPVFTEAKGRSHRMVRER